MFGKKTFLPSRLRSRNYYNNNPKAKQ